MERRKRSVCKRISPIKKDDDHVVETGESVEDFETDDVIALGDEPERVERFLEIAKKKGLDVELVG